MSFSLGQLRKSILGSVSQNITALSQGDSETTHHLGKIVSIVVQGFHTALEDSRFEVLVPRLNAIEPEFRGFGYEGAGMGLLVLDSVFPWKKRLRAFLAGPGTPYIYPIYVGVGLALAKIGKQPEQYLSQLDPVVGWFLIDGYAFRWAILSLGQPIQEQPIPEHLSSSAGHLFDQGFGRGIWFTTGASIDRIAATVAAFSPTRQADLWSGVGFACAYAGGVDRITIETLRKEANLYRPQLARGAAVAAKARQRSGNLAPHTNLACEVLCGLSSEMAAQVTDVALQNIPVDGVEPAYEIWRKRIEAQFAVLAESEICSEPRFA